MPIYALISPIVPLVLILGFKVPVVVAFIVGVPVAVLLTHPGRGRSWAEVGPLMARIFVKGLEDMAYVVALMLGIGMMMQAAKFPYVAAPLTATFTAITPTSSLLFILFFGILLFTAVFRGPTMPWAMGAHPEAACAAARILRDAGLDAFIGESGGCGTGRDTQRHFEVNGLAALAAELDIPLVDFKRTETVEVPVPEGLVVKGYHIAKPALEADFRVSVPVIKTHCEATMTLSMKNMKGCLPIDDEKSLMHSLDLNSHLADLNTLLKPRLAVVDGIVGLMGYCPGHPGIAMNLGLMLAGTEAVAVDATCARVVGYAPHEIEHLRLAEERGLGSTREEDIEVVGLPLAEAFYPDFVRPPKGVEGISRYPNVKIVDEGGCSSCITELAYVLNTWVPEEKQRDGLPLTIVLGRNAEGDYGDNVIAISGPWCPTPRSSSSEWSS